MSKPESALKALGRLVGTWTTEATHPAVPGVIVRGTVVVEWLEGERFLIHRGRTDHADFPDSMSVIGFTERDRVGEAPAGEAAKSGPPKLVMHYYDSRGVFRAYDAGIDDQAWRYWREAPGFSQRFTGTFADGGATIIGIHQLREDDVHWKDDLKITYRRQK